jgi:Tol biopolymer transport system component
MLAYKSPRDGDQEIYVVDVTGDPPFNEWKATDNTESDNGPDWSPDGSRFAFASLRDGNKEVYVMTPDGSYVENLTNTPDNEGEVDWSVGNRIAFVYAPASIGAGIGVYDYATGFRKDIPLSQSRKTEWSPDGSLIASWAATFPSGLNLFLIDPDEPTPEPQQLTFDGYDYPGPAYPAHNPFHRWSPDGAMISITDLMGDAYGENSDIVLVPVNGDPLIQFTESPVHDRWGDWAPNPGGAWNDNNSWIVFQSNRDGVWSILVRNVGTGEVRTLTDSSGNDHAPLWAGSG